MDVELAQILHRQMRTSRGTLAAIGHSKGLGFRRMAVRVGEAFLDDNVEEKYYTVRFDFVPASVDHDEGGLVQRDESNAAVIHRKH